MHIINSQIYIDSGLLNNKQLCNKIFSANKILIVSEQIVADLYLKTLQEQLTHASVEVLLLKGGEENKTWDAVTQIISVLTKGHDRGSLLISLGGGVIGDLTGFAAAIFMRGINFVQIPTTLLAQVDAAIGGKTGCNFLGVKNLLGAFHQPQAVLVDPAVLATLSPREYIAGLAEVIKYGFACDAAFFTWLEVNKQNISLREAATIKYMITRCCELKQQIVQLDPLDQQQRLVLNFGHTFAHAIEAVTEFNTYLHGEAVALGMLLATRLAVKLGLVSAGIYTRLVKLLEFLDLPIQIELQACKPEKLYDFIRLDKKRHAGKLRFILPCALGRVVVKSDLEFADAEDFTRLCLKDSMIVIGDNV